MLHMFLQWFQVFFTCFICKCFICLQTLIGFYYVRLHVFCFYLICNAEQCISIDLVEMERVPRVEKKLFSDICCKCCI
jgi:hypothetical protein